MAIIYFAAINIINASTLTIYNGFSDPMEWTDKIHVKINPDQTQKITIENTLIQEVATQTGITIDDQDDWYILQDIQGNVTVTKQNNNEKSLRSNVFKSYFQGFAFGLIIWGFAIKIGIVNKGLNTIGGQN